MANITSSPQTQNNKCPLCVEEFKNGERKEKEIYKTKSKTLRGIKAEHKLHEDTGPKTGVGEWMVNYFIPQFENNVMALVYLGAAFLVVIVGLRGVGEAINNVAFVPKVLIDKTIVGGEEMVHLSNNVVIIALLLEFFLITSMAFVMFFKPEQPVDVLSPTPYPGINKLPDNISQYLTEVRNFFEEEIKSPLIDKDKKKQVQDFIPIMDFYIEQESQEKEKEKPTNEFDPKNFRG